jgi:hypothetical protein
LRLWGRIKKGPYGELKKRPLTNLARLRQGFVKSKASPRQVQGKLKKAPSAPFKLGSFIGMERDQG